jgi:hypothetical protein
MMTYSADGWRDVLEPVVSRYRDRVKRLYFRGDAAFAMPKVCEFLEAQGMGYAIRLPANRVLQDKIAHLLKRPVGRPPQEVRRYYPASATGPDHGASPGERRPKLSGTQASFIPASASS